MHQTNRTGAWESKRLFCIVSEIFLLETSKTTLRTRMGLGIWHVKAFLCYEKDANVNATKMIYCVTFVTHSLYTTINEKRAEDSHERIKSAEMWLCRNDGKRARAACGGTAWYNRSVRGGPVGRATTSRINRAEREKRRETARFHAGRAPPPWRMTLQKLRHSYAAVEYLS